MPRGCHLVIRFLRRNYLCYPVSNSFRCQFRRRGDRLRFCVQSWKGWWTKNDKKIKKGCHSFCTMAYWILMHIGILEIEKFHGINMRHIIWSMKMEILQWWDDYDCGMISWKHKINIETRNCSIQKVPKLLIDSKPELSIAGIPLTHCYLKHAVAMARRSTSWLLLPVGSGGSVMWWNPPPWWWYGCSNLQP